MRVDPLSPRAPISIIGKTAKIMRSTTPVDEKGEQPERDLADPHPRRGAARFVAASSANSHATPAVLSALIDLQTKL